MGRVYLSGPIHDVNFMIASKWRTEVTNKLKKYHKIANPMLRNYKGMEQMNEEEIVLADKEELKTCNIILVNAKNPSWGTAMELLFAYELGMKTFAFLNGTKKSDVSPWLYYHCDKVFKTLDQAIDHITKIQ